LPASVSVCYKRYMRKWIRERVKRRKKDPSGAEQKAAAPTPLQPKFYDNETVEPEVKAPVADRSPEPEPEPEPEPQASVHDEGQPMQAAQSATRPRPSRRRRGRGGRGRRQQQPAVAAAAMPDTESAAPEQAPVREAPAVPSAGTTKGTVVLAIGLPGSGKSSWFKRHSIRPLSSDMLRELLFDDAHEQRFQDLVFSNLRSMLKARLIARRPMNYVDATNLTPHDRQSWIKLAKDYGYDVQGVYFDVPLDICLERNHKRTRTVEDDVMRKMSAKLKAPTFDEGFSKITVVRVKKKDNVEADTVATDE
jgi:predicted kinase